MNRGAVHGVRRLRHCLRHRRVRVDRPDELFDGRLEAERHGGAGDDPRAAPPTPHHDRTANRPVLDTPHDAGPQPRPVRVRRDRERPPEENRHSAAAVDLLAAAETAVEMVAHRTGRPGIEGTIEIGAEAAAGKQANHDAYWTPIPRADILMPS